MNQGTLTEHITRSLAYMLRHQPDEFDLELDAHGYGEIGEVVCALNERLGEPVTEDDVHSAIDSGDRPRYEIVDGRIRALYGHSIHIEPGEPAEPPELLYVGVGSRDADRADQHGLRGGRRTFLHLALTPEDAREAGRRIAEDYAVITVRAGEAHEDGYDFYDRKSLFLAESIPTDFIDVGEMQHDGVQRDTRGRSDRDRGRRPSRGRDRDDRDSRGRSDRGGANRGRDDRGRGEGRSRGERRDREAGRRDDRGHSDGTIEPRPRPEPKRPSEPAPRSEARPAAKTPAPKAKSSEGFGLGIFEEKAPKKASKKASAEKPRRPAKQKDKETASSDRDPSPPAESGGSFGLGL